MADPAGGPELVVPPKKTPGRNAAPIGIALAITVAAVIAAAALVVSRHDTVSSADSPQPAAVRLAHSAGR